MYFNNELSDLKDHLLRKLQYYTYSDVVRDRINFILWEFKFLDCFLYLKSFPFASECGMLHVSHKMIEIWKSQWNKLIYICMYDEEGSPFDAVVYWKELIWQTKQEFRAQYSFPKSPLAANEVMEVIDVFVGNINVLVKINDPCSCFFVPGLNEQIERVLKELKLLRFFVCFVSNKCSIQPQYRCTTFYTHALIEASYIAMVVWLHLPIYGNGNQDLAPSEVSRLLSDFMEMKIKSIEPGISRNSIYIDVLQALKSTIPQAQKKHVEIPTHSLTVGLSDQMANLQEMLCLLRDNLIHLPILDLEFHLQAMDSVIVDSGLLIYSLYDIKREKEDTVLDDMNRALGLDLPRNIEPIKVMVYLVMQKAIQCNLPKVQGLGYVDFLLKNLKDFQGRYSHSLSFLKNQLQVIQTEFESLQPFLKVVVEEPQNKLKTLNEDCATQIIRKAYEVEYVVDACINKVAPHWCLERWLQDIIEEITCIKAKIQEKNTVEDTMKTVIARTSSQLARTPRMNEEIVGFEDVIENLRKKLLNGTKGQDVISIHGMPGLGKTTLANRLYSDRSVVSQFDICAQCCVSQVYSYKDLLLSLLRDAIGEDSDQHRKLHDNELADKLRKTLLPRRYLILVDDVWENSAWDDLRGCFPDVNNRSRIILTTRHHEVAKYASVHSDPLHLRMFDEDESWKLLEKKVFGEQSCSPLLRDVGLRIAKMCGQLPLSIILVAGILSEMKKEVECWEQVANNLGTHIHNDSRAIVDQSYHVLPCHLKSCFLYFGAFLEDRVIDISRLIRLWISESFIKSSEGRRLEDIAEGYLENLIGRNLVMVIQRADSCGKVKACRLHDVLLDFCKKRAAEENFLLWINRDQITKPSSCVYSHKQHAHLAFTEIHNLVEWSASCSFVGAVVLSNKYVPHVVDFCLSHAFDISRILPNFKFLKVLDLEHQVFIDFIPTELPYLRYFSALIDQNSIPSSISNLWNLETLILKHIFGIHKTLLLPSTIWDMVKLRHLHIPNFSPENEEALLENSAKLYDLETISTPHFSRVEDAELMLRKTPFLRKLIFEIECLEYPPQYHVLNFPIRLEILKLYQSKAFKTIPFCISAPNLKYLKLGGFYLDSQYLSEIADHLKHLEVLILYYVEFGDHREWKVSNGKFPQLKILKLEYLSLMKWIVADDAFPNLEQLVLHGCQDLMEIPSCFMDILSLQYIEVGDCNESVVKSAMNIQETQVEDNQNTNFKLIELSLPRGLVLHLGSSLTFLSRKWSGNISDKDIRLFLRPGIESVSSDEKEKKLTVTGDVDADEVQLVVEKLRKRGMPGL